MAEIAATNAVGEYERKRKERIALNRGMLAELGLLSCPRQPGGSGGSFMAVEVQQEELRRREERGPRTPSRPKRELVATPPSRRSARVEGRPAISFNEDVLAGILMDDSKRRRINSRGESTTGELYTVADLNALRSCTTAYENHALRLPLEDREKKFGLYKKDTGSALAKTTGICCHWCRQKDTSPKTLCSGCGRGQLCGPCLQGRYGENIFEIIGPDGTVEDWLCPVCRGICNCSGASCLRQKRGWGSTGALALTAKGAGYESVAHYLILGAGFDDMIQGLTKALASNDVERLRRHLEIADKMSLQEDVKDLSFPLTHLPEGEEACNEVLFIHGHSATAVVGRLRQLVADARARVAPAVAPANPSVNLAAQMDLAVGGGGGADHEAAWEAPAENDGQGAAAPALANEATPPVAARASSRGKGVPATLAHTFPAIKRQQRGVNPNIKNHVSCQAEVVKAVRTRSQRALLIKA